MPRPSQHSRHLSPRSTRRYELASYNNQLGMREPGLWHVGARTSSPRSRRFAPGGGRAPTIGLVCSARTLPSVGVQSGSSWPRVRVRALAKQNDLDPSSPTVAVIPLPRLRTRCLAARTRNPRGGSSGPRMSATSVTRFLSTRRSQLRNEATASARRAAVEAKIALVSHDSPGSPLGTSPAKCRTRR